MALRRSRSCPPWKVLRLDVPRGKRVRSGVLLLMLCAEGDAVGARVLELELERSRSRLKSR